MRTSLTLSPEQFAFLASVVRYRGNAVQPHGERFVWQDRTTPRTDATVRFLPRIFLAGQYPGERPYFPSKVAPRPFPPV